MFFFKIEEMEVEVHVANRIQLLQKKIVSIKEKQKKHIFQGYWQPKNLDIQSIISRSWLLFSVTRCIKQ